MCSYGELGYQARVFRDFVLFFFFFLTDEKENPDIPACLFTTYLKVPRKKSGCIKLQKYQYSELMS